LCPSRGTANGLDDRGHGRDHDLCRWIAVGSTKEKSKGDKNMLEANSTQSGGRSLRIGVGAPLSGMGSDLGREMVQAVQLAIDEANRSHSAPDLRLTACILDDEGEENQGFKIARSFADDESIVAVVGHYNSDVTLRTAPLYHEAGLPLVAPIVSNPKLTESGWSNVFRFTNRDDATADAIAGYITRRLQKSRAVVVETDTTYGRSMSDQFVRAFERENGSVLMRRQVREGKKDFAELVAMLPNEMDVLFYGGTFEGAPLLKAMRSSGLHQLMAAGDGCWDVRNFLEPASEAAEQGEGVLVLSACPEVGTVSGSPEFSARYERQFGPIRNYAVNSFDATMMLLSALRTVAASTSACPNRRQILEAMRQAEYQGIAYSEPVRWDAKGDNSSAVTALHIVKGRKFRQVALVPQHVPN
jgi:branched-chain amino acid transport system substrate-binding protein